MPGGSTRAPSSRNGLNGLSRLNDLNECLLGVRRFGPRSTASMLSPWRQFRHQHTDRTVAFAVQHGVDPVLR